MKTKQLSEPPAPDSEAVNLSLLPEVCIGLYLSGPRVHQDGLHRGAPHPHLGVRHVVPPRQHRVPHPLQQTE